MLRGLWLVLLWFLALAFLGAFFAGAWWADDPPAAAVTVAPPAPDAAVRRKLDACMAANNEFLELSAKRLKATELACTECRGALASFLDVDPYTGFRPDHPACEMLRELHAVLPKECRDWAARKMGLTPRD